MAIRFHSGLFQPTHVEKYLGGKVPKYRSSWELTMMRVFDTHPSVIGWSSECISIPYQDPVTGRWRLYIPDFFVVYIDAQGKKHGDIIEVKPARQTLETAARSKKDRSAILNNMAKWKSALSWCQSNGLTFRVMTEAEIFRGTK